MSIATNAEILALLDRFQAVTAEDLESQWLEFKPWTDPRADMRLAAEYAACLANGDGGVIVFGVADQVRGRAKALHGVGRYDRDLWIRSIYDSTRPNLRVDIEELAIPEGTGRLLLVRVPKGGTLPHGTAKGLYQTRVGKNCMPLDPQGFLRSRVASGALDWSAQIAEGVTKSDLDPIEIERARGVLRREAPESPLLKLDDNRLLSGLGVVQAREVTHAGLLLFGREEVLTRLCPQHQVHYVYQTSATAVARNDSYRFGLLHIFERIENNFTGPANPEEELSLGFFKMRIPSYPVDAVREAVLNAVTHRDYLDPADVLVRHTAHELVITSPGGFIAGITPQNILRHEHATRNKLLAEVFEKLRLVERAGIGRSRMFIPILSYGKRAPRYETDGTRVTLRIFNGSYDERMATLVAKWRGEGREIGLDALLILAHLRENAFIDTTSAAELLQTLRDEARTILDALALPATGILDRRGHTRAATYHLTKSVAKDLLGKAAYTKTRGLDPIRYEEMVRAFVVDHGSVTPRECRQLLGLGESQSARVEISKLLNRWSRATGFLRREGKSPKVRYFPR